MRQIGFLHCSRAGRGKTVICRCDLVLPPRGGRLRFGIDGLVLKLRLRCRQRDSQTDRRGGWERLVRRACLDRSSPVSGCCCGLMLSGRGGRGWRRTVPHSRSVGRSVGGRGGAAAPPCRRLLTQQPMETCGAFTVPLFVGRSTGFPPKPLGVGMNQSGLF